MKSLVDGERTHLPGYTASALADVELSGMLAVVTGANSGVGFAVAEAHGLWINDDSDTYHFLQRRSGRLCHASRHCI